MTKRSFIALSVSFCVLTFLSACVDHSYDFDRADKSVTLGGEDLAVPLGSTRRLKLGDLVDKYFGNLFVAREDGTYLAHYDADPVDFVFSGLKDYDGSRPFRNYCNLPISTSFSLYNLPNSGVDFDAAGKADLSGLLPSRINLGTRSKGTTFSIPRMPEQLLGLEAITLTESSRVKVTFSIPDCVLTEGTVTPTVSVDLSQFFRSKEAPDGIVTVSVDLNRQNNYSSTIYIPLYQLLVDPECFDAEKHVLTMDVRIGFSGSVAISGPGTTRTRYQEAAKKNQLQVTAELLDLSCESIRGRYDYTITELKTHVDLRDLTAEVLDKIGDREAVFDFDDPEIILDIESNISTPTYALVHLIARKDGQVIGRMDSIAVPFPVSSAGETLTDQIRLAKTARSEKDMVLDFTGLIRLLPDEIDVDIHGYTYHDKIGEIRVGEVYEAHVIPHVNIPIAFGPALQLTFRDTLTLPEELGAFLAGNPLTLSGEITNTLPLDLTLGMSFTDETGSEVLEPVSETIAGSGTSSVTIPLRPLDTGKAAGLSKALVSFRISGTEDNRAVRADDYVQASFSAAIPGGYHLTFGDKTP